MKILLDTHIFLWFISGDAQLSTDVRDAIRAPDNEVYLSAVSVWEATVIWRRTTSWHHLRSPYPIPNT
ncbi:PIN domain-containing protein [Microcoleus sp. D2_18a_D3]|uniref:PIN domain-containing protein n=1 Tax=Microcoleus sp. D2_18a_D3 TaxID=3055330 RepID=UPI002FD466C9